MEAGVVSVGDVSLEECATFSELVNKKGVSGGVSIDLYNSGEKVEVTGLTGDSTI